MHNVWYSGRSWKRWDSKCSNQVKSGFCCWVMGGGGKYLYRIFVMFFFYFLLKILNLDRFSCLSTVYRNKNSFKMFLMTLFFINEVLRHSIYTSLAFEKDLLSFIYNFESFIVLFQNGLNTHETRRYDMYHIVHLLWVLFRCEAT